MCAHYWISANKVPEIDKILKEVEEKLKEAGIEEQLAMEEVYPGTVAPVIVNQGGTLDVVPMVWGFPRFDPEKPENKPKPVFNTRSETAGQNNFWRKSLEERRCVIPTTGFFEWKKLDSGKKKEVKIDLPGEEIVYIAGIFRPITDVYEWQLECFSMMTTEANASIKDIHNRMPVVLRKEEIEQWLKGDYKKLFDRRKIKLNIEE